MQDLVDERIIGVVPEHGRIEQAAGVAEPGVAALPGVAGQIAPGRGRSVRPRQPQGGFAGWGLLDLGEVQVRHCRDRAEDMAGDRALALAQGAEIVSRLTPAVGVAVKRCILRKAVGEVQAVPAPSGQNPINVLVVRPLDRNGRSHVHL